MVAPELRSALKRAQRQYERLLRSIPQDTTDEGQQTLLVEAADDVTNLTKLVKLSTRR